MAAIPPLSGNHCKGSNADGSPFIKFYCLKGNDAQGDPIYTCTTWRKFKVNCPKINFLCNRLSEAYVAAVTVCNQKLF